jgi:O-antigen/teichoic acid export membrane protein
LQRLEILSAASALGAMAATSLIVSAGCLYRFRQISGEETTTSKVRLKSAPVIADHWRYGRWAALTAALVWIPANIYYVLLPERFGLESTAFLRAMMNLAYPLVHTVSALVPLLIPVLVQQRKRDGLRRMKRTVLHLVMIFAPMSLLYLSVVVVFRGPILHVLYAGKYNDVSAWTVVFIGCLPILTGISWLVGAALRALERPRLIFWSYLASAVTALAVGIPITMQYGVPGAAFSLAIQEVPTIIVLAWCVAQCGRADGVTVQSGGHVG